MQLFECDASFEGESAEPARRAALEELLIAVGEQEKQRERVAEGSQPSSRAAASAFSVLPRSSAR